MKYIHKSDKVISFRQQINIKKFRSGGRVVFKDGSEAIILRCSALNLALMNESRQLALLSIYKELLDSLDLDSQILIRIRNYPASSLADQMTGFRPDVKQKILKRDFYFILKESVLSSSDQSAAWRLSLKAQSLIDNCQRLGLKAEPLNRAELATLYFQALNPLLSRRRETLFRADLAQALRAAKPDWGALVTYQSLTEKQNYLRINESFSQTLVVSQYPSHVDLFCLNPLIDGSHNLDLSYQLRPVDNLLALPRLNRKITELESQKRSALKTGQLLTPEIIDPLEAALKLRQQLLRGQESLYQLSLYLNISAPNLKRLQQKGQQIIDLLAAKLWRVEIAKYEQLPAWRATLPEVFLGSTRHQRNFDSSALACTFPFSSLELVEEKGLFYGLNKANNSPVVLNRFALANANALICAQSGAGKSYLAKLEILRAVKDGLQIIVIDPENEYQALTEKLNGRYIHLTTGGSCGLNPLWLSPLPKLSLQERLPALIQIIELMVEGLEVEEKAILDRILIQLYKKAKQPDLKDLWQALEQAEQTRLCLALDKFVSGSLRGLFNGQEQPDLENQLTVFNLQSLSENLRPLVIMIIANLVAEHVLFEPKQRLLIIDEAWLLLKDKPAQAFLEALVRRARKYYLGVTLISQQLADFCEQRQATALLSQASLRIFLRQDSSQINTLKDNVDLSSFEKRFLTTCSRGEALVLADNLHILLKIMALPEEHPLITTNPAEVYKGK